MASPTKTQTKTTTNENPFAIDPSNVEKSPSVETSASVSSGFQDGAIPTGKLDAQDSIRFTNQGTNPNLANKTGEIAVVRSNAKLCLRSQTPLAAPVYVPMIAKTVSFMQTDVSASQTAVALDVLGLVGNTEFLMPIPGAVIAVAVSGNEARTAGSLTVDVTINGTVTGLQAVLNATNAQYAYATQEADQDVFTAGQRIGVKITTTSAWLPTTADIVVLVVVQ